jgi:uncharacterized membrane protein YfcA
MELLAYLITGAVAGLMAGLLGIGGGLSMSVRRDWATGFIYWPAVAGIVLSSIPLAPLGARLAHHLPELVLQRVFALVLLLVGVKMVLESGL